MSRFLQRLNIILGVIAVIAVVAVYSQKHMAEPVSYTHLTLPTN